MTAALCSAATGPHVELLDAAFPTFERYGAIHHMDVYRGDPTVIDRPPSWYKIGYVGYLLAKGYDTVVWVDADACFVSYDRDITEAATKEHPLWMVRHRVTGRDYTLPNCGVLVARHDPRLCAFLNKVWEQEQWIDHPWWEQAAILHLLGWNVEPPGGLASPGDDTEWTPLVGWLPTEWNSMRYDPHPDPVIRHYTGTGIQQRLAEMRADTIGVAA